MQTSTFTFRLSKLKVFLSIQLLLLVFSFNQIKAQCALFCPPAGVVHQVSLSAQCQDTLTTQLLGIIPQLGCVEEIFIDLVKDGVSYGDVITDEMIGDTFIVMATIPTAGQACMFEIVVVDKQDPVVTCPNDVSLPCNTVLDEYIGLTPDDVSDCSSFTIYQDDELVSSGNCVGDTVSLYRRTYIIVDTFNNADTCIQSIALLKADLEDVVFPVDLIGDDALSCSPPPVILPSNTGYPTVDGQPILNGGFCNLSAVSSDLELPICDGSYKIMRTWTVFDWCAGNADTIDVQVIEILDTTPPAITAPADLTISTALNCEANLVLPPGVIIDDCSTEHTVRMSGPFGTIHSNGGVISGLPAGVHTITYIVTSSCLLEGTDQVQVTVQDLQPPTPVCHEHLAIPVGLDGTTLINASVFNAGSSDNCGPIYFKVKRMSQPVGYSCDNPGNPDNQFDDFIQFCCEDIANNNIMVIFRVYDTPPVPGPVTDDYLSGHFNECMVEVEVQDKLGPIITCPTDITISCEFPYTMGNLDVFGTVRTSEEDREEICINDPGSPEPGIECLGLDGLAYDNCAVVVEESAVQNINNCGVGSIVRTFTAEDAGGVVTTCQQIITIINYSPFLESDITWPLDYVTSELCDINALHPDSLPAAYGFPVLNEGPCDLAGYTYDDLVFDLTNDDQACFKILRTWTVADWCQINSPSGGTWEHLQVIKVMNSIAPVIAPLENVNECSYATDCSGLTLDFEATATDDCSSASTLTWRYFVDVDDDGIFDFSSADQIGSEVSFSHYMPIGNHRITFTVWDQCGNASTSSQTVDVASCKGPSAKCIHGLSTNLMPMDTDGDGTADWGMVVIRPEMFDAGSDHPCGNTFQLAFSSDTAENSLVFDCNDIGTQDIELWVIDENGLTDFCPTYIIIDDNNDVCPEGVGGQGTISGNITVPGTGKLAGASIQLEGSNLSDVITSEQGYFIFPAMPLGGTYTVKPKREGDDINGVNTLDLIRIQKHLLGIEPFTTPYQYIAADANNNQSISAIDLVQIRKLILGYDSHFPNNSSWRFVDHAHIFPDPFNPWSSEFPESYSIQPFSNSMSDVDFDAVKIGDLNGTVTLAATGNIIKPRTAQSALVNYTVSQESSDNNVYRIEIYLKDAQKYQGVQFSYSWDIKNYELVDWQPGDGLDPDQFRVETNSTQSVSLSAYTLETWKSGDKHLMTVWFKSSGSSYYAPQLLLQALPTAPIGFEITSGEEVNVRLDANGRFMAQVHNQPNPFKDFTTIRMESEVTEEAQLSIVDMNGRIVLTRRIDLIKGKNEFMIRRSELGGPGIYQYEIESKQQLSKNRMIIVE